MRVLFIHQNFPAQFRYIAPALWEAGHDVRAVTSGQNTRKFGIPVSRYEFHPMRGPSNSLTGGFQETIRQGRSAAEALLTLRNQGFTPDVVVGHVGWGESLSVKDVWPRTKLIVHAEFYYSSAGANINFDPEFPSLSIEGRMSVRINNAPILLTLLEAEQAVTPTEWQRSRFPLPLQDTIEVVHEGIDTALFAPSKRAQYVLPDGAILRAGDEVITFVNRDLEPYRGYHIFMRALPGILKARPEAQVVIVGGDGHSYGPAAPQGTTWKAKFLAEVSDRLPLDRVHFVGKIPYNRFLELMQVSRVHIYLTYPFVLSWSLLEAMSAGCLILASRTPPVEELVVDGENGFLFEFFDHERLSDLAAAALACPEDYTKVRAAARQTIKDKYDREQICLPAWLALVERVGGKTSRSGVPRSA